MSQRVYRYRLANQLVQALSLPAGARVLAVAAARDDTDALDLWAQVDPAAAPTTRTFMVAATGDDVIPCGAIPIGTAQHGHLVWHVFEVTG